MGASPNQVSLSVVVTPQHGGTPIAGLTQQDFTVLDNGAPQTLTSFHAFNGTDAPVEVIVVVDAVNAFYQTVSFERGQIEKFLKANGGKLPYPTALAVFTDTGTQIQQGFSTDGNVLSGILDKYVVGLRDIQRSAGIYGAAEQMQMSVRMLSQLTAREAGRPGRKIVLWVSPGWPILTGPHIYVNPGQQKQIFSTIIDISTSLRKAGITLYAIDPLGTADIGLRTYYYQTFLKGIRKPSDTDFADLSLQVLATQSGGLVLNSSNDVTAQLTKAVQDVSPYYVLSFEGKGEPNEYHQLAVKVQKPGVVARTRTGYYSR
jgi:VWFA-related protein